MRAFRNVKNNFFLFTVIGREMFIVKPILTNILVLDWNDKLWIDLCQLVKSITPEDEKL